MKAEYREEWTRKRSTPMQFCPAAWLLEAEQNVNLVFS
jgi:hypothetical protein